MDYVTVGNTNYKVVDGVVTLPYSLGKRNKEKLLSNGYELVEPKTDDVTHPTTLPFLTSVKGIGDAYGRQIMQEYETLEELAELDSETLAHEIPGLSETKAELVIQKSRGAI